MLTLQYNKQPRPHKKETFHFFSNGKSTHIREMKSKQTTICWEFLFVKNAQKFQKVVCTFAPVSEILLKNSEGRFLLTMKEANDAHN